ncbi:MAG: MFS transporter [Candidatus Poseidoniaceae archaeon]|jgi:MFS family permease|nr:MFS transporter [Candidatus Poseidoniaceae archaeon]
MDSVQRDVGFIELLRINPKFRKYWIALSISLLGEWFNTVALFVLVESMTNSELAIGAIFILRMFALAIPQIFTGVLADRYSRKWLMVFANVASALLVMLLFLVDTPSDVWLVYFVSAGLMVFHAVYVPAENAALPNLVEEDQLLTANALNSATWSASLAIGASLGGLVVSEWGVEVAFIVDAATFALAAIVIATMSIPQNIPEPDGTSFWRTGLNDIAQGWKIIRSRAEVSRIIVAKALWSISGGGLVFMLILIGSQGHFGEVAAGIGILFAARGIGTGIGPLLARYAFTERSTWPLLLGLLVSTCGLAYLVIGLIEWNFWIVIVVILGHAASGANWVLSTVLLQERSEDEWRGRMFATDFFLMTSVHGFSTLVASLLLENTDITLRQAVILFSAVQIIVGLIWLLMTRKGEREYYLNVSKGRGAIA